MSQTNKIKVLIADDHNMVRKGLVVLLEDYEDIEIVANVGDGQMAYDRSRQLCPNVVLMDIVMPHMDGIEATRLIREACPETQVIALTSLRDDEAVKNVLEAGAISYLMKDISGDDLAEAIRRAHSGESTLAPSAAQVLIQATVRPPALGHDLTPRERDVLALMIEGLHNGEIGDRLGISRSTVKNHVSSILSKLHTDSRTHAVALAVEHKLLD